MVRNRRQLNRQHRQRQQQWHQQQQKYIDFDFDSTSNPLVISLVPLLMPRLTLLPSPVLQVLEVQVEVVEEVYVKEKP